MQEECLSQTGSSPTKWSPQGPWAECQEILRGLHPTFSLLHQRKYEDPREQHHHWGEAGKVQLGCAGAEIPWHGRDVWGEEETWPGAERGRESGTELHQTH